MKLSKFFLAFQNRPTIVSTLFLFVFFVTFVNCEPPFEEEEFNNPGVYTADPLSSFKRMLLSLLTNLSQYMDQRFTILDQSIDNKFKEERERSFANLTKYIDNKFEEERERSFANLTKYIHYKFEDERERSFANLTKYIHNERNDIISILTKYIDERLLSLEQIITGSSAIDFASNTAVRIEISPGSSDRNNTMASGNLISIAGMCYVSTNRHVLVTDEKVNRTIKDLRLVDDTTLTVSGNFSFSNEWDLALVPVSCPGNRTPLAVAHEEPKLGTRLFGLSNRPKGLVLLPCSILEKRVRYYETDCPETHGFSGTGYLNGKGTLIALHVGAGKFGHLNASRSDLESMDSSSNFDWDRANTVCTEAWRTQEKVYDCFAKLRTVIELTARNPRTSVVSAVHLLELAKK
jgi:hypothetical protein